MQIVDDDYRNRLAKFENIHLSVFEYFNDAIWLSGTLKSMVMSILFKITVKFLKTFLKF